LADDLRLRGSSSQNDMHFKEQQRTTKNNKEQRKQLTTTTTDHYQKPTFSS